MAQCQQRGKGLPALYCFLFLPAPCLHFHPLPATGP